MQTKIKKLTVYSTEERKLNISNGNVVSNNVGEKTEGGLL